MCSFLSRMGSTGEADRKRRHFSSISPTGAAAKKQPFAPLSEDKKVICESFFSCFMLVDFVAG